MSLKWIRAGLHFKNEWNFIKDTGILPVSFFVWKLLFLSINR